MILNTKKLEQDKTEIMFWLKDHREAILKLSEAAKQDIDIAYEMMQHNPYWNIVCFAMALVSVEMGREENSYGKQQTTKTTI